MQNELTDESLWGDVLRLQAELGLMRVTLQLAIAAKCLSEKEWADCEVQAGGEFLLKKGK